MLPNMRNLSSRRRRMSGGADESLAQGKNFAANMPGQMRQSGQMGGGNVYHGAPVLAGDAMLLDGDLRGKAGVEGLDASTAAIRGMQDGGRRRNRSRSRRGRNNASARRGRNNASARRSRSRRGRNNASARRSRSRRGRNNASARRSRRGRNNAPMRRGRNNASARRSRRGRNNASARRSRRGRNNASARRRRRNQIGGEGEEEYPTEMYEGAVTPLERRRNNMYGGAHSLLPTDYASVNQSPSLISGAAATRAGTAFSSDPFANGAGSA